jgi:hypothetical protein
MQCAVNNDIQDGLHLHKTWVLSTPSCLLHGTPAAQICLGGKIGSHAHHTSASKLGSSVSVSCVLTSCMAGAMAAGLLLVA